MCVYIYTHSKFKQHCLPYLDHLHATKISKCSSGHCIWDWYFTLTSSATKWVPAAYPDLPCCLFLSPLPQPTSSNLPELDST